jgi:ABC-type bacteriocin/lantibiotic exporter with double-glycine peptidase domain
MKRYLYITLFVVFLLSLAINVSGLTKFTFGLVADGTIPIQDPTTLILIGMGLLGLTGVSRKIIKK